MESMPFYPFLHQAQLANTVTGFATCMAGIMPLLYTLLTRSQPKRWVFVYLCIFITGVPTVWFHAFEQSKMLAALDTSSNILLAWAWQMAILGDFAKPAFRRAFVTVSTIVNLIACGYQVYEATQPGPIPMFLVIGDAVNFKAGELALITNSIITLLFYFRYLGRIERHARPLLYLIVFMFIVGAILAGPTNDTVAFRFMAWHALWHIWGAFALTTLWIFNFVRFYTPPPTKTETA
jgi:hypothetical protein